MHRFIFYIFMIIIPIYAGIADTVSDDIKKAWGYYTLDANQGSDTGDFLLAGTNGSNNGVWNCGRSQANRTKSHGAVVLVARKIVAHGGYFCPTQVQCDSTNDGKQYQVWLTWYNPDKFNTNKCAWLCDEGYAGEDCAIASDTGCSDQKYKTNNLFGDTSMRVNGEQAATKAKCESVSSISSTIQYFDIKSDPGREAVLGVTKILEHGVVAAPVKLECKFRKDKIANLNSPVLADGNSRILCAEGYRPSNGDCVVIDQEICNHPNAQPCPDFPIDKFDKDVHTRKLQDGCWMYTCADPQKAFASATDKTCSVDCSTNIKRGVNTKTGLCKVCNTGEYFEGNECKPATAYTKEELKYGKKSYTKEKTLKEQCWTMVGPDYVNCVNETKY